MTESKDFVGPLDGRSSVKIELDARAVMVTCGGTGSGDFMSRVTRLRLRQGTVLVDIIGSPAELEKFVRQVESTELVW